MIKLTKDLVIPKGTVLTKYTQVDWDEARKEQTNQEDCYFNEELKININKDFIGNNWQIES